VSRTPPGVARNQNGDGDARSQFYARQTRGDAPSRGAFCLYHEADASQAPDTPSRVTDRGEPRTPRGGRRTRGVCTTTAHPRTATPAITLHGRHTRVPGPQETRSLPLGGGMTKRGVLGTRWQRTRRVLGKVLLHHLFFLDDPPPEHQEITGETKHEDDPRPHDQGEST
jgi:hypothetical protein